MSSMLALQSARRAGERMFMYWSRRNLPLTNESQWYIEPFHQSLRTRPPPAVSHERLAGMLVPKSLRSLFLQKLRRLASPSPGSQNHGPSAIASIKVGKWFNSDLQLGSPQSFSCMVSEELVSFFYPYRDHPKICCIDGNPYQPTSPELR
jgi:hypothetical protein